MPTLTWTNKNQFPGPIRPFAVESLVYPAGRSPLSPTANAVALGDNLAALYGVFPGVLGRPVVAYADPPFFTNKKFSSRAGRGEDSRRPQDWQMAPGYDDTWATLDDYLNFLYRTIVAIHAALDERGTLYLHLDWRASAYARLMLDEVFGRDRFLNEIIWTYHGPSPIRRAFSRKHDTILAYTKSDDYIFNADAVRVPYDPSTVRTFRSAKAGFGKTPDLARGKVPEDYWHFPVVARLHSQRTGYPTQKPEALLERIILASSNPGDLVADFFCGSGTTAAVAARLGRRFFTVDTSPLAVLTARARLLGGADCPPFSVLLEEGRAFPRADLSLNLQREGGRLLVSAGAPLLAIEAGSQQGPSPFLSVSQAAAGFQNPDGGAGMALALPPDGSFSIVRAYSSAGQLWDCEIRG